MRGKVGNEKGRVEWVWERREKKISEREYMNESGGKGERMREGG